MSLEKLLKSFDELKLKTIATEAEIYLKQQIPSKQQEMILVMMKWIEAEKAHRYASLVNSRVKSAKFEEMKTVDVFDFNYNASTKKAEKTFLSIHNNITKTSLPRVIFYGDTGLGKTHLAKALGFASCQQGLTVLFTTAAKIVNDLEAANKLHTIEIEINKYKRPQVLIIDEFGYVNFSAQASNLFFQLLSARHAKKLGLIATTNLAFSEFGKIFAYEAVARVIVDRIVSAAEVFTFEGKSYRLHERELAKSRRQ